MESSVKDELIGKVFPVLDDGHVILCDVMGDDRAVVDAARVSFGRGTARLREDRDLIRYLMRNRHGCYDAATEVLTDRGWKRWPDVNGQESFATIDADDNITYQGAERLVVKDVDGQMIRIAMSHVDLLVTPDHNMLANRWGGGGWKGYRLVPAKDFLLASHRIRLGGGQWLGSEDTYSEASMELLGLFIGDGCNKPEARTPCFHLRKTREITFLIQAVAAAGFELTVKGDVFHLRADEEFRSLAEDSYNADREKVIPRRVLELGPTLLKALFRGLMHSDGTTSETGKQTYSTTSKPLADQVQELALKIGRAAVIRDHPFDGDHGHLGSKPRYRVTIYRGRNMQPRVGWTRPNRLRQVYPEHYSGKIYCVTVPNGTLYVRRNGIPCWCGNTPFEMAEIKLRVRVPMDCWRQWIRHRTANVNEYSTRYSEAIDSKQKTDRTAWRLQSTTNKQGSAEYLQPGPDSTSIADMLCREEMEFHERARQVYEHRLGCGIAREQARKDLPISTYTEAYWKCDLRNVFHFLGLRMDGHAQAEIRAYANIIGREIVAPLFPACWEAFEDYQLGAMTLSRLDIRAIRLIESGLDADAAMGDIANARERAECRAKLERLGIIATGGTT